VFSFSMRGFVPSEGESGHDHFFDTFAKFGGTAPSHKAEWVDEAAFELHASLPHTTQFVAAAGELLTHPIQGLRLRQIGGGPGRALR